MAAASTSLAYMTISPGGGGGGGDGGGGGGGAICFGTMVVSPLTGPGAPSAYRAELITIWSISTPSSRTWTRTLCVPSVGNHTSPESLNQYALRCQPQPTLWHVAHVQRLTLYPPVVPIRYTAAPAASTLSENCTKTESFH